MSGWERSLARSLATIRAHAGQVRGCTIGEIRQLESTLGRKLPASYVRFLEHLGRSAGSLLTGSDFDITYVRRTVPYQYRELLAEDDLPPLPPDAFVFFGHHDYQFFWFELNGSEDPPVWYYLQGTREHVAIAASFSAWLERIVVQEYGGDDGGGRDER